MDTFWIIACALVVCAIAALLPALLGTRPQPAEKTRNQLLRDARVAELRRDVDERAIAEQDFAGAQDDIDRALLEETNESPLPREKNSTPTRWIAILVVLIGVPGVSLLTYLTLGMPEVATGAVSTVAAAPEIEDKEIDNMLADLRQRLTDDPDNAEGWLLLGRSYMSLGRYSEAAPALAKTIELVGERPQVLLQYADALVMAAGGAFGDEVRSLVARSLAVEPNNIPALWLAALGVAEIGGEEEALVYLRRARKLSVESGMDTAQLDAVIEKFDGTVAASPVESSTPSTSINITLSLAPKLVNAVASSDVLFVFARAPGPGGPPLAVKRTGASGFPLAIVLDETMSMAPMFKLQAGQTVTVTARISKSGTPGAVAGDLEGTSMPFVVGESSAALALEIDHVVPPPKPLDQ
jgi:cytochrome c-type biogenesis protein CcmH